MPNIPQSAKELPSPGEWSEWIVDGKRTALFCCPECFSTGTLETHTIAPDGLVSPSVRCEGDCGYHQVGLRLQGWKAN